MTATEHADLLAAYNAAVDRLTVALESGASASSLEGLYDDVADLERELARAAAGAAA